MNKEEGWKDVQIGLYALPVSEEGSEGGEKNILAFLELCFVSTLFH